MKVLSTPRDPRPVMAKNVRVSSPGDAQVIVARQAEQRERALQAEHRELLADLGEALDAWEERASRDEDALARIAAIRERWGMAEHQNVKQD